MTKQEKIFELDVKYILKMDFPDLTPEEADELYNGLDEDQIEVMKERLEREKEKLDEELKELTKSGIDKPLDQKLFF